jgi:hypothetical protein
VAASLARLLAAAGRCKPRRARQSLLLRLANLAKLLA